MGKSILHMAKPAKHQRLFELIRQGNLAEQVADRSAVPSATAPADLQVFRTLAAQSISPQ